MCMYIYIYIYIQDMDNSSLVLCTVFGVPLGPWVTPAQGIYVFVYIYIYIY